MIIKKINFIGILLIILILPIVSAQKSNVKAGITPDSFLWGLDKALDNLNLLLTFDKGEKAKKGIEIARERLLEVREMIEENKLEAAEKAKEEHGNLLNKVKESVKELEKDNSTEQIEEELEIEKELKEHEDDVEEVNTELKVKIKIEGAITAEQRALINSLLDSLKNQTGEVKIEIKNKKDKTKIKIKTETGKSEKEIEDEIEDLEEEIGLEEIEVKVEIIGNKTQIKIENGFSIEATDKNATIDEIIKRFALDKESVNKILKIETEEEELKEDRLKIETKTEDGVTEIEVKLRFTLNTTDRDTIVNEVVARSQLSKEDVEKVLELKTEKKGVEEEEEIDIKVEIEEGVADVKIEIGDDEQEFTLETIDREAVLSEIASRLGVTVEQIRNLVEFEKEGKKKEKREIEVEIYKKEAEVKIEINDAKLKFTLNTTDKNAIIQEIAERTGLSVDEVAKLAKFEEYQEKEENGNEVKIKEAKVNKTHEEKGEKEEKKIEIKTSETDKEKATTQSSEVKEFKITARQFQFEPSTIEVNKGDKVRLIVTSLDVPHGISIPEYSINEGLEPNKPITIEFTADKQGTFTSFCSVFCGSGHSNMKGKLVVK